MNDSITVMQREPWIENIYQLAIEEFELDHGDSYHGRYHWETVERNALHFAQIVSDADPVVCQLFALIHDCKRQNESYDPEHGHRSAQKALEWHSQGLMEIDDNQLELLMEACKWHNDGQTSDDPTVGVCWDSDRFDLPRVGIEVNGNYLSTKAAKLLLEQL